MKNTTKKAKVKPYVLSVKMDPKLGKRLRLFADEVGFSVSDVVKASVRRSLNEGSITIEAEVMTPKLERALAKIDDDIKHGRNIVASASTDEEIDALFEKIRRGEYENRVPSPILKRNLSPVYPNPTEAVRTNKASARRS